ncbi:MAG: hypothetical protein AVO39_06195 [delta proteobacterium MLS_D]|nr:MAG: hypothetical protein AVO39_06195 [delta proteobacterium MLS_D]
MMNIGSLSLSNGLFLAPMAGISDSAFRMVARSFGASLCYSEMISAEGLVRGTGRSFEYLASPPGDKPLGIQLFGANPEALAEAAIIAVEQGADLVDINMGCPVKKVIRNGAGAALMKDPARVAAIVSVVRRAVTCPLTVKLRSGWSEASINVVEIARIVQDCGVDAVTVHPRTAVRGFRGGADWRLTAQVKNVLSVPVIGSGDIWTAADIRRIRDVAGCDAVMVARGSLGNPWIFRDALREEESGLSAGGPSPTEREETIRRHMHLALDLYGENRGMFIFRKHMLWYTKGLPGGARFRKTVLEEKSREAVLESLHRFLHSTEVLMSPDSQERLV